MRQLKITYFGISPYLMNNPASMIMTEGASKTSIPTPEQEAASKCYWLDEQKTSLAVPATHVRAALIKACARYKVGKQYLSSIMVGATHVAPEMISLNSTDYKLDIQTVTVQKARIFRCRPKVMCPWEITFELHFDPNWLPIPVCEKTLPEIMKTSGSLIGIGDYRTEKKGPFGRYYLKCLELLPEREETVWPEPDIIGFDFSVLPEPKKAKKAKA